MIYIPHGKLALTPAEKRRQLRDALLAGQTIIDNRNPIPDNDISIPNAHVDFFRTIDDETNHTFGNLNPEYATITENFALRIINACVWLDCQLAEEKKFSLMELNKQLLRSGTSISANCQQSKSAQSNKDYIQKLETALKEARETFYWLKILTKSNIAPEEKFGSLIQECNEIITILVAALLIQELLVRRFEAEDRQQLHEALLTDQTISVAPNGQITNNRNPIPRNGISIPKGKIS